MRRLVLAILVLLAVVAGYLAVAGWMLARGASALLEVGTISAMIAPGTPETDPFVLGFRGDPAAALGLGFETVTVDTPLGPSPAWLVPGPRADLAAIYVHGVAGAREDGYRHLSVLQEAGLPVLLISYRNDPAAPATSDGRYGMGTTEWPDLEAAVAQMVARGHDRLLLVGESMGGAIVGQFLRRSALARHVAALALDSPALDFGAVLAHLAAQRGLPAPEAVGQAALAILSARGPHDLRDTDVLPTVAAHSGPLFLAHGAGDEIVPVSISARLLARRSMPTHHLRTAAGHLQSWHADPDAYRAAFGGFVATLAPR